MTAIFEPEDIISIYTRQNAIDDGIFVDVTEVAKKHHFTVPVAITTNLFNTYIKKDTEQETNRCLHIFLSNTFIDICHHPSRDKESLLSIKSYFDDKTPTEIWVAIEPQSPTDPSLAINLLLPEDY